ncbi:MAG: secretion protein HlyD [Pseudomonadales bacterium]
MSKRIPLVIAAGLALALGAYFLWPTLRSGSGSPGALILYGNVDLREVRLGFRVSGRLAAMNLEEGDAVSAGALMATLDGEPYRQALASADAAVRQAHAALERLQAGSRPQEIESAQAAVRETEAQTVNAVRELERQQALRAQGASSQQLLDAAIERRDQTQARLVAARENLALVVEGPRREDIDAARAAANAAEANRDAAATRLDDTALRAPAPGIIATRVREPGTILGAGEPVYLVTLNEQVFVRAYVAEPDLGRVVPGQGVLIRSDAAAEPYRGQVGFVSPRAEFTPKTVETTELRTDLVYRLRIIVDDADPGLRQGMPVTVEIEEGGA